MSFLKNFYWSIVDLQCCVTISGVQLKTVVSFFNDFFHLFLLVGG